MLLTIMHSPVPAQMYGALCVMRQTCLAWKCLAAHAGHALAALGLQPVTSAAGLGQQVVPKVGQLADHGVVHNVMQQCTNPAVINTRIRMWTASHNQ